MTEMKDWGTESEDVETHTAGGVKGAQPLTIVWQFLTKLSISLFHGPDIPLLGIYRR